jgi:tetratricopeptide (TPR) repeat protein
LAAPDRGEAAALRRAALDAEAAGDPDAAAGFYMASLHADADDDETLIAFGRLTLANGQRDAARALFIRAAAVAPADRAALVTLGNMALEDDDPATARAHYNAALARDADCADAHQGLARLLWSAADPAAAWHEQRGFAAAPVARRMYRGAGQGIDALYLAAARGGNVRLGAFIDDTAVATTVVYPDYVDPAAPLPAHRLIINAIGDADLAGAALARAETLVAVSGAPVINHPARVAQTGRATLAQNCKDIPGLLVPATMRHARSTIAQWDDLAFPILLRTPGQHTGRHFGIAHDRRRLDALLEDLPGDALFVIPYLDARGADGLHRKYRVMFIDDAIYPWHLAISRDWKVHYFTAAMAEDAAHRAEEQFFLGNMAQALGARAMVALDALKNRLGLDYAGADFALDAAGNVLLFEANAAMVMHPPPPGEMWDYRRPATEAARRAARIMIAKRAAAAAT